MSAASPPPRPKLDQIKEDCEIVRDFFSQPPKSAKLKRLACDLAERLADTPLPEIRDS